MLSANRVSYGQERYLLSLARPEEGSRRGHRRGTAQVAAAGSDGSGSGSDMVSAGLGVIAGAADRSTQLIGRSRGSIAQEVVNGVDDDCMSPSGW